MATTQATELLQHRRSPVPFDEPDQGATGDRGPGGRLPPGLAGPVSPPRPPRRAVAARLAAAAAWWLARAAARAARWPVHALGRVWRGVGIGLRVLPGITLALMGLAITGGSFGMLGFIGMPMLAIGLGLLDAYLPGPNRS